MRIEGLLILVVSLDAATERRTRSSAQLKGSDFAFVSAIDGKTDESMGNRFVTPPVDAIWNSHKKAYTKFLSSNQNFCLILEDDFLINDKVSLVKTLDQLSRNDIDLIQLGWLETGSDIWTLRLIEGFTYRVFRCLNHLSRFFPKLQK